MLTPRACSDYRSRMRSLNAALRYRWLQCLLSDTMLAAPPGDVRVLHLAGPFGGLGQSFNILRTAPHPICRCRSPSRLRTGTRRVLQQRTLGACETILICAQVTLAGSQRHNAQRGDAQCAHEPFPSLSNCVVQRACGLNASCRTQSARRVATSSIAKIPA